MKKTYKMYDLDCANCARKMEDAIGKIDGVTRVSVNFLSQKLVLEAEDAKFDSCLQAAIKAIHKVDPDCEVAL